jgi:hypothetical protein
MPATHRVLTFHAHSPLFPMNPDFSASFGGQEKSGFVGDAFGTHERSWFMGSFLGRGLQKVMVCGALSQKSAPALVKSGFVGRREIRSREIGQHS